MHDEERNPALFALLAETLRGLAQKESRCEALFVSFQIRLIAFLGFGLDIRACFRCGNILSGNEHFYFHIAGGNAACPACEPLIGVGTKLSAAAYELLNAMQSSPHETQYRSKGTPAEIQDLQRVLNGYIVQHCESKRPLRSSAMMNKSGRVMN